MLVQKTLARRDGAVLVEAALVYPIVFMIVFGIIIMGLNTFRYHQVAHIAREASRWASVRGGQYEKETGNLAATPSDIFREVILPHSGGMHQSDIGYTVTWSNDDNRPTYTTKVINPTTGLLETVSRANTVTVTVSHSWDTGIFGRMTVDSTSVNVISY